jgi:Skp family chaperone for outer membrane proteins
MDFTPRAAMAALAIFASTSAQQAPVKVAYVDVETLMAKAPGRDSAAAKFQRQADALNAQFQKMTDSASALEKKFSDDQAKGPMAAAEKDKRQKAIVDFEQGVQAKQNEYQGQLEKLKADLMLPIQVEVKDVLEEIRQTDGYTIIFDNSQGSGAPVIAVADKNLDLTEKAMAKLLMKAAPAPAAVPNGTVKKCPTPPCSP